MPAITTKALPAGRMQVLLASSCRAGETLTWRYGGTERQLKLDGEGRADLTVDAFAGTSMSIEMVLADGTRVELPLEAENLGGVTKVALVWRGPADLDLHAFEHATAPGKAGHVWSGAASSAVDASRNSARGPRGAGFLSTSPASGGGDRVAVYTFVHATREGPGHISFAVQRHAVPAAKPAELKSADLEPAEPIAAEANAEAEKPSELTPEAPVASIPVASSPVCNPAALAEVPFRLIVAVPGQPPITTKGIVAATDCGAVPIVPTTFDTALLPALRLGSR